MTSEDFVRGFLGMYPDSDFNEVSEPKQVTSA